MRLDDLEADDAAADKSWVVSGHGSRDSDGVCLASGSAACDPSSGSRRYPARMATTDNRIGRPDRGVLAERRNRMKEG